MNFDGDGMERQQRAELVERHALPRQDVARQHRVRALVEHVVLREGAVGLDSPASTAPARSAR